MEKENEYIKEKDAIISEIGNVPYEDLINMGITPEEYINPTAQTIEKLIDYANEKEQVTIYSESDIEE